MRRPSVVGTFAAGEATVGYTVNWVVSVRVDGVELDLEDVVADVTVRQGRDSPTGSAQASAAAVTLWPVGRAFTSPFRVGVELELAGGVPGVETFPLFTGRISDAELVDDALSLIAAGVLANANRVELALAGWVAETWSARAARVIAATPFAGTVQADSTFDPVLEPAVNLDTGTMLFESYAGSLANAVGAVIADTPDGRLLVQALGGRRGAGVLHELDPALVIYSPRWVQALEVVNAVGVQYGPDDAQQIAAASDQASIDLYDRRYTEIDGTRISSSTDAATRAAVALSRGAYPRWVMPDATVLEPIPNLAIGDRVLLTELPAAAPAPTWSAVVEGWTHRIAGAPQTWVQELALSDPALSGLALTWADLAPLGDRWVDVDPELAWYEADNLADFV